MLALGVLTIFAAPSLAAAPANDNFANATVLSGATADLTGVTNAGATGELGEPNHGGGVGGSLRPDCSDATTPDSGCEPSLWYSWTAPHTAEVTIDTCNAGPDDFQLPAIYTGNAVNALSEVALLTFPDPSSVGCSNFADSLAFTAVAGTTYRIAVSAFQGATVTFSLHLVQDFAPNDAFAAATPLSGDSIDLPGQTNAAATGEPGEPNHADSSLRSGCSDATTPDPSCMSSAWYTWSASSAASVTIDLCDPATKLDTTLAVYTGSAVGGLSGIASNDDAPDGCPGPTESGYASRLTFRAQAGTTYRIAVAGYRARQARFGLHLRASPLPPPPTSPGSQPSGVTTAGTTGTLDHVAPRVSAYAVTNTTFVVAGRSTPTFGFSAAKRHRKGTTFRYSLSEAARVRIVISQRRPGRRKGRRCAPPTRKLRRAAKCTRLLAKGTLTRISHQGANRVTFTGKIGSKALKPGIYEATLSATDAARNASQPKTVTFRVVRR